MAFILLSKRKSNCDGYLAVDFFYVLSGFVIGYAYDERCGKMGLGGFDFGF